MLLQTPRSAAILAAIGESEMVAPDLITAEVLSALRRLVRQGVMSATRADQAVGDLVAAPIRRLPMLPLAGEVWRLCRNVSAYDACSVALAAELGCVLVSVDRRLAGATDLPVRVVVP